MTEETATLTATHGPLRGTTVTADECRSRSTSFRSSRCSAASPSRANSTTVTGAEELRAKETDRIAAVAEELGALGGKITPTDDGFIVEGTGGLRGGRLDSRGDHRIAMIGALAGAGLARTASRSSTLPRPP